MPIRRQMFYLPFQHTLIISMVRMLWWIVSYLNYALLASVPLNRYDPHNTYHAALNIKYKRSTKNQMANVVSSRIELLSNV